MGFRHASLAEVNDVMKALGLKHNGEKPLAFDGYVSIELAPDLGVSFFELEGIPFEEPYTRLLSIRRAFAVKLIID